MLLRLISTTFCVVLICLCVLRILEKSTVYINVHRLSILEKQIKQKFGRHLNHDKYALWGFYIHQLLSGPEGFNLDHDQMVIGETVSCFFRHYSCKIK